MKNISVVLKHEFITFVTRRSFLLTLFLLPLISFIILLVVSSIRNAPEDNPAKELLAPPTKPAVEGFVDHSAILKDMPADLEVKLISFSNEEQALNALQSGEIDGYYVIPLDYLQTGEVEYVRPDFNPITGLEDSGVIERALNFNLLGADLALTDRYQQPFVLETTYLSQQPQRDPENMLTFFLPYGVTLLFYIVIFGSASLMLNSITSEKQNRVMEILMTSITPIEMLAGKIIALGAIGLLQTVVWSGTGFLLLRLSGRTFSIPAAFQLNPTILVWGIVFFILGYALYASLMAGVGALVPNMREATQATIVLLIPMIIPLMLISALSSKPNGSLAIFLGLFPLTSPVTMMARLAATRVPIWQLLLAVLLLATTAYLVLRSVSGMFRAQNLLSGQPFKLKIYLRAILARK
jgi:ABC-2 type transport system permease protein